jgi:hypothetical protein
MKFANTGVVVNETLEKRGFPKMQSLLTQVSGNG